MFCFQLIDGSDNIFDVYNLALTLGSMSNELMWFVDDWCASQQHGLQVGSHIHL